MNSLFEKFIGKRFDEERFNCWTLVEQFYAQAGYTFKHKFDFPDTISGDEVKAYFEGWSKISSPKFGDLVLFKKKIKGVFRLYHCGVMVSHKNVMQCLVKCGVCLMPLSDVRDDRIEGIYRFKNVDLFKDSR